MFTGSDPDGDTISYFVNWGDGSKSGLQGPYSSGTSIELSHNWSKQGYYTIKAKVFDEHNVDSDWSSLEVSMPKQFSNLRFRLLFQLFPIFERFVEQWRGT